MISKSNFCFIVFEIICALSLLYFPPYLRANACIILADIIVIVALIKVIKERFVDLPFFFFNITYFLFILSGGTVTLLSGLSLKEYVSSSLSDSDLEIGCLIAFLGIAIIDAVYFLWNSQILFSFGKRIQKEKIEIRPTRIQEQFVIIAFAVTSVCKFMMAFETMIYSQTFGYISLYTRETSNLPSIIRYIGALFYFTTMLFLSCKFSKTITYPAMAVVLVIELLILNSGDRGEAACGIIILIIYIIQRTKQENDFFKHKKVALLLLLLLLPICINVLQMLRYTRIGEAYNNSFGQSIYEFFESQGVSLDIITYGVALKDRMSAIVPEGTSFIWGQITGYLQQNVFMRTLFGFSYIRGNTVEMALSGNSYGSTMAYLRFKNSYLNGIGCGTCFLAELYQDASWIGIIIGSVFVAFLLKKLKNISYNNWIVNAFYLNCMRIVLVLPRGAFFKWLTEIFSIPNLMLLIVVLILGRRNNQYMMRKMG